MHTINFLIHNLDCRVRMAHQALAQQICTVPDMARANIDMDILVRELLPRDSRIVVSPVSSSHVVLYSTISSL